MALVSLYIKLQDAVDLLGYYTTVDFNIVYETICYSNTTSPCLGIKARASPPPSKYTLPTVNPDPDLDNRLQCRHVYCAGGPDRYYIHKYVPITSMDALSNHYCSLSHTQEHPVTGCQPLRTLFTYPGTGIITV